MKKFFLDIACWIEERPTEVICIMCILALMAAIGFGAYKHRNDEANGFDADAFMTGYLIGGAK